MSMLFVVDAGNSQTSFGIFQESRLLHHWRAQTSASRTPDEFAALLFPLLTHAGLSGTKWEGVAVASVVPAVDHSFAKFCEKYLGVAPFSVHGGVDFGGSMNVDIPAEVGADRVANAAYAVKRLKLPAIVVDLGTATTFDVIGKDRRYEGGAILPGVHLGVNALGTKTAKLPIVDLRFPSRAIGKNTVDCIRSGLLLGYCDWIDGLLDRLQREAGSPCDVALTGGLASFFHKHLRTPSKLLPDLTLEGIELVYRRNQARNGQSV